MRRAIIIVVSLLLAAAVIFSVYTVFNNKTFEIKLLDLHSKQRALSADGTFTAKFKYDEKDAYICGYKSEVENGNLYLYLVASKNKSKSLPMDSEGFVDIEIRTDEKVSYAYYRLGKDKQILASVSK